MNKVFLDKNGKVFVNGNEITDVSSISVKTEWSGTNVVLEFKGDYKSDFRLDVKTHVLDEASDEDVCLAEVEDSSKETYEFQTKQKIWEAFFKKEVFDCQEQQNKLEKEQNKLIYSLWLSVVISTIALIISFISLIMRLLR